MYHSFNSVFQEKKKRKNKKGCIFVFYHNNKKLLLGSSKLHVYIGQGIAKTFVSNNKYAL